MQQLELVRKKILDVPDLKQQVALWKFMGRKIAFTNGCFDILHLGHIDYLCKAADMADVLVVGVNSDASTARLKGPHRPVCNQAQRTMILASLHFVDAVTLFDTDTPYEIIKLVQPDVLVKGGDYKAEEVVGADIVKNAGGSVRIIDFLEGYSTSAIETRIRMLNK